MMLLFTAIVVNGIALLRMRARRPAQAMATLAALVLPESTLVRESGESKFSFLAQP